MGNRHFLGKAGRRVWYAQTKKLARATDAPEIDEPRVFEAPGENEP